MGIPTVERAVIQKDDKAGTYGLLVEGTGLQVRGLVVEGMGCWKRHNGTCGAPQQPHGCCSIHSGFATMLMVQGNLTLVPASFLVAYAIVLVASLCACVTPLVPCVLYANVCVLCRL